MKSKTPEIEKLFGTLDKPSKKTRQEQVEEFIKKKYPGLYSTKKVD